MKKIFLSYRRETAIDVAGRIKDYFSSPDYDVFYDIDSMKLGKFNIQIEEHIKQSNFFIVILSKNSLDRCLDKNDWVRKEIELAIKYNIKIIPLIMPGFSFPENLPESINEIRNYHGLEYNSVLFDLVMKKLETYLNNVITANKNPQITQKSKIDLALKYSLEDLYTITTKYRDAFRNNDQQGITTNTNALGSAMQSLYYFYEKNISENYKYSDNILMIIRYFNDFVEVYNKFANSQDRKSIEAQNHAMLSEVRFKVFVNSIITAIHLLDK